MVKTPLQNTDIHALRRVYLFSGLEDVEYLEAISHATSLTLAPGQHLFSQGDPAEGFFWVAEGVIRLFRASPEGEEKVIDLIGPNRFFAEAVLFMGTCYPINASAQSHVRLIAFDGRNFRAWLAQDSGRCFRLLAAMSARIHKLVNEIDRLTLMKGADRLLQYLLDHSDPDETGRHKVELEAPKQVIASRIGVKPETFSRLLHKLTDYGCVEVDGNTLYILDPEQIRQTRIE
jgi:CRP-like cAMP-binding protein